MEKNKEQFDVNELIKIESLPKVYSQLEKIGNFISEQLIGVDEMKCTDENKQEVKKRKQEITATKNILETRRKDIKKAILEPYELFNKKYEEEIKTQLEDAEKVLNDKVNFIENKQKLEKTEQLKDFFENHQQDKHIEEYSNFEDIGLNITLSASMKSLESQIIDYCEKVEKDLKLIDLEEFKDEILVEYKNTKDYSQAKINVYSRHKQLEEIKQKEIERQQVIEQEQKIVEQVQEIVAPVELEEEKQIFEVSFTVKGTKEQLKELKQFMVERNIEYV